MQPWRSDAAGSRTVFFDPSPRPLQIHNAITSHGAQNTTQQCDSLVWGYLLRHPVGNGVVELRGGGGPVGFEQEYFSLFRSVSHSRLAHVLTDDSGICLVNGNRVRGPTSIEHGSKISIPYMNKEYIFVDCAVSNKFLRPIHLNESYGVAQLLGTGTYGEVHLCFDKKNTKAFALKIVMEGNERERDIVCELNHPNLVKFYDFKFVGRKAYITMEYVAGGDLSSFVHSKGVSLSVTQTKLIFYQIVEAVSYLHGNGICHRDLKPANILLVYPHPHTLVKVTDFGLSKSELLHSTMKTAAGTPYFMAPEILDKNYSKKIDVWSLGVILCLSLTGSFNFITNNCPLYGFEKNVINLLDIMLQRDPNRRACIVGVAQSKWLQDEQMKREVANLLDQTRSGAETRR